MTNYMEFYCVTRAITPLMDYFGFTYKMLTLADAVIEKLNSKPKVITRKKI